MNENDTSTPLSNRGLFQIRLASFLWAMVVVGSFFAGRYSGLDDRGSADDRVINTTWTPGYSVPMAIIGPIDLDGDGTDDVAKLKALITKNGGTVVASQNSSGEVAGRVDSSTRFLVVEDPWTQ